MSSITPLTIRSFPRAILHIDGDAFFASCEQSLHPELKGRPVVTGRERGIAASMSYEAKAAGVTRGMRIFEVQKLCPDAVILPSDYETYSLLSKRLYDIVRRYTSAVEEYGIDECFAEITGLRRPLRMSYPQIAKRIQDDLSRELGFTFSIGLGPTKVIAKVASKWKKPAGLTVIPGREIHQYLHALPIEKIWGIGSQTTAHLAQFRIVTALQFAKQPPEWVRRFFTKPFYEIWQELNGISALGLVLEEKTSYFSIQKFKTFTPPSSDARFIFAQLSKNIENACIKARRYQQAARQAIFCLRTQDFRNYGVEVLLSRPTAFPSAIVAALETVFDSLYSPLRIYRQTGVILCKLTEDRAGQMDLFGAHVRIEKMRSLYRGLDQLASWYGKHAVYLGSSFEAHALAQHSGERGYAPRRVSDLLPGETKRKRLNIPRLYIPADL